MTSIAVSNGPKSPAEPAMLKGTMVYTSAEKGGALDPTALMRDQVSKLNYCESTFLRPEATGGGAAEGNAAGALASRTTTWAGASIALPPVALAI